MGNELTTIQDSWEKYQREHPSYNVQNKYLQTRKVTELRNIAKDLRIKGYSSLRKQELIEKIDRVLTNKKENESLIYPSENSIQSLNVKQLKKIGKELNIPKYYNLRRDELITAIQSKTSQPVINKLRSFTEHSLKKMKVEDLKKIAKENKITGYSYTNRCKSIRKENLIILILEEKRRLERISVFNFHDDIYIGK